LRILYRPATNKWEVWEKSGLHYVFGDVATARVPASPDPGCSTFAYALTHIDDPNGNALDVTYTSDTAQGIFYPNTVRYGGTTPANHKFEVAFVWTDRPAGDQIVNSLGGFSAKLTKLLSKVEVRYLVTSQLVRWYQLEYEFQTAAPDRAARQSFLSAVTLFNGSGVALSRADGLPASTTFLYQQNDSASGRFAFGAGQYAPQLPIERTTSPGDLGLGRWSNTGGPDRYTSRDIFDMNGDGIADLVDTRTCSASYLFWDVYLGTQAGFATQKTQWAVPTTAMCGSIRHVRVVNGYGDSQVYSDTFDLNGDAIPDWVLATAASWSVYLGHAPSGSSGWGFNTTPSPWTAPSAYVRASWGSVDLDLWLGGSHWKWTGGVSDAQDLLDVNGDGLLDFVQPPPFGGSGPWKIWLNTGSAFETGTGTSFPAPFPFLRYTTVDGTQVLGVYDMNGDGLPDQVVSVNPTPNSWTVYLNSGHGIANYEVWTAPDVCTHTGIRDTLDHVHNPFDVARDLLDINGDGLPDLVTACAGDSNWHVRLNRGDGFAPQESLWPSPVAVIRDLNDHDSDNAGGKTFQDTFDVDGDGMVDLVDFTSPNNIIIYRNAGGAWCASTDEANCGGAMPPKVAGNPSGGRPDLLQQVENGLGGTTYLTYRPSTQWNNNDNSLIPRLPFTIWTVTRIEQDDGLCNDSGTTCLTQGSHTVSTDLRYYYGFFEPMAREFRGFGTVEQYDAGGNLHTTWFHQDAARKGKVYSANSYAGGSYSNLLVYTYNYWVCVNPDTQAAQTCPQVLPAGERRWVRLAEADRYDTTNYAISKLAFTKNQAWDSYNGKSYGNVIQAQKGGTGTTTVTTNTEYAYNTSAYIVNRPKHVSVTDGTRTLDEKWFTYDSSPTLGQVTLGNVTAVYSWLDQVIDSRLPAGDACQWRSGNCVSTQMAYDSSGNITTVVDANGNHTITSYDSATNIYPYEVTNAAGQAVATAYDPASGKVLWQTVTYPSGQSPTAQKRTQFSYDSFCRLSSVTAPFPGPGATTVQQGTQANYYSLGAPWQGSTPAIPSQIIVENPVAGDPTVPSAVVWLNASEFFDALGRHLEANHEAIVDGSYAIVVDDAVQFDALGRVVTRYAPFAGTFSFTPSPPAGTGFATYAYDPLGRVTQLTNPDGTRRTMEHNVAWQTTAKDECYNAGNCPGSKTIEKRDASARVIEKQLYKADTFETRTGYTYDGLGRLTQTQQGTTLTTWQTSNPDTTITTTYDSLGRKIKLVDPDTGPATQPTPGTWKYGYDRAGNLIFQDDPKSGQRVEFCYDTINRVTAKYYHSDSAQNLVNCASEAKDYTKDIVYRYDEGGGYHLGRLTSVIDPSNPIGNPPSPATVFTYDVRGRTTSAQKAISVNGNLRTALLYYSYDVADHPKTIQYPPAQGESTGEVVTYTYDDAGQVKTMVGAASYLSNLTYDLFGRPRVITHGNGTTDTRTYYDKTQNFRLSTLRTTQGANTHLNLSYASYNASGLLTQLNDLRDSSGVLSNTATYTYDGLGRLTQASGVNLPAPNTYTYNALGNMTLKEGTTLPYSSAKPHQLMLSGVSHDDNGNRLTKSGQTYIFNGDDRLTQVTASGSMGFVYDYTGRQVARVSGTTGTRYFSELAEAGLDGYLMKYYFAAALRIAARRVYAPLLAALPHDPAIQLAQGSPAHPAMVLVLRRDVQQGLLLCAVILGTGLLVAPWQRKRVVGIAVRHGHVIAIVVAFGLGTLPWPLVPRPLLPAAAEAQSVTIYHFHVDHLGSTQVVTDSGGAVLQQVRYKPFGQVRYRGSALYNRYEFTGYESESTSGLDYAGARFYDPALGSFLTHDPIPHHANPYSYVGWNPTNDTDPNGECGLICGAIIAAVLIVASINAVAIDAYIRTGDIGVAARAGAAAAASSAVGPNVYGLQLLDSRDFGRPDARAIAISYIPIGGQVYGTIQNFKQGNYASGVVGAVAVAFELYGYAQVAYEGYYGSGLSPQQQLEINKSEFGQNFSTPFQRGLWSSVTYAGKILAVDVYAAVVGNTVGKLAAFLYDFGQLGEAATQGNILGVGRGLLDIAIDLPFPNYGWYNGRHWGTTQFGNSGVPTPLNGQGYAGLRHDVLPRHLGWVRNSWGFYGLPAGPIGQAYKIIGTGPFAIGGALQNAGWLQ
jgi:RHS repeat-associated protein